MENEEIKGEGWSIKFGENFALSPSRTKPSLGKTLSDLGYYATAYAINIVVLYYVIHYAVQSAMQCCK